MTLEHEGGDKLFGEPALNIQDLMQTSAKGEGVINILTADKLINSPKVYATLLLWLLSDLFEKLPELGDPAKPICIFFFDEAHLLFTDAPKVLLDKIEQMVRLIRSKGVGVYFCTQSPLDLPETVVGQLGNRVQHALRAFTPKDQKAVKTAAETFRANPKLNVVEAITQLEVGEGLVSVLDEKGVPTPVERAWVLPPQSRLTPLTPEERQQVIQGSVMRGRYEKVVDRESAYEILQARAGAAEAAARTDAMAKQQAKQATQAGKVIESMAKSAARSIGTQLGRQLTRGIFGRSLGEGRGSDVANMVSIMKPNIQQPKKLDDTANLLICKPSFIKED